jgi:uncharacterized membrane protein
MNTERKPMTKFARKNLPTLKKTGTYYLLHITVAALVAYAVTGDFLLSLTLSLLEPTVQAFAFFFHEKAWQRWGRPAKASPDLATAPS